MYSLKTNGEFLEESYRSHAKQIRLYCKRLLQGHYMDATDECVQNTFLHAGQQANKLKKHPNIKGWLYRTSRNQVNNVFRKCYIKKKYEIDLHCQVADMIVCGCLFLDEALLRSANISKLVEELLNKLNPREQKLYQDYFKQHLSILELSMKYGISTTAVTSRIHSLRKKIKNLLQEAL